MAPPEGSNPISSANPLTATPSSAITSAKFLVLDGCSGEAPHCAHTDTAAELLPSRGSLSSTCVWGGAHPAASEAPHRAPLAPLAMEIAGGAWRPTATAQTCYSLARSSLALSGPTMLKLFGMPVARSTTTQFEGAPHRPLPLPSLPGPFPPPPLDFSLLPLLGPFPLPPSPGSLPLLSSAFFPLPRSGPFPLPPSSAPLPLPPDARDFAFSLGLFPSAAPLPPPDLPSP